MEYGILSIVIPLLTILLAIITKDVIVSLVGGIFSGLLVLNNYNPLLAFIEFFNDIVMLFSEGWIVKTVLFMLLVGSIIQILSKSGAVDEFVAYISKKASKIDSPTGAMMLSYIVGVVIFIESSITSLISGTVARPLCDKHGVSREKLSYICDSTSAPICSLIPLNAWGALLLGLIVTAIDTQVIHGDGIALLIASIPYNFYAIFTLIIVLIVILFKVDIGPMKEAKASEYIESMHITTKSNPLKMVIPIFTLMIMVPITLYITGDGDIFKGSGSTSVYYAVVTTLVVMYIYFVPTKTISHTNYFKELFNGISSMLEVTTILIFALFIGKVIGELQTAQYLASILNENIPVFLLPLLVFLVSSITAFSTGTSWGTFSIMMPIALALGATLNIDIPIMIAAVISGGIFGDHASPISDTTIISSMAAKCDHISHVRTQLPYAIIGALLASIAFLIVGVLQS